MITSPSKLDRPEIADVLFHPRKSEGGSPPASAEDLHIELSGNGLRLSCRLHLSDREAPVILHFHGNGEIVDDYDDIARDFTACGINIFFATYRGYGNSTGSPTVSGLFNDNIQISAYLRDYLAAKGYSGALFAMGRSLGAASAIDLVSRCPDDFKGLILDSSFADTLPLLARLGCMVRDESLTESDGFNNLDK
ncbi:MAG: alpha/beta hydrolase, partial [Desulfocapsaceae bacterium]|nr:alpha/beta hydrolase [Desulfocapsaceae bacterium]